MGGPEIKGTFLGDVCNEDYSRWGSIVGFPYLWNYHIGPVDSGESNGKEDGTSGHGSSASITSLALNGTNFDNSLDLGLDIGFKVQDFKI